MFSVFFVFFFKQKTSYELLIIDWISDVCSSDLVERRAITPRSPPGQGGHQQSRAHADGDDHAARWCPARHQRPAPAASRAGPSTSASSSRNRADSSTPVDTSPYHAASKRSVASVIGTAAWGSPSATSAAYSRAVRPAWSGLTPRDRKSTRL